MAMSSMASMSSHSQTRSKDAMEHVIYILLRIQRLTSKFIFTDVTVFWCRQITKTFYTVVYELKLIKRN